MIYLDNHRATRPSSKVLEKMNKDLWMSLSAPYFNHPEVIQEIKRGLGNIYDLTGAPKDRRFLLTSGEENAAEIVFAKFFREVVYTSGKNFILAPVTENAPIRKAIEEMEQIGCVGRYLPVNAAGQLTVEILEKHYTPKAGILALSWANPLTGVIQPVEELSEYCKKKGILVYVQGSEMFAKLFMRLEDLKIDYFSFASDLIHGPSGVGGLFINEKIGKFDLTSITHLPGLIGMGVAAGEVLDFMDGMNTETAYLRSFLEEGLSKLIGDIQFFGKEERRLPNTSCFAIPGIHGEYLTFLLSQKGVMISYGGGRVQKLEYILLEMGVEPVLAKSAVSIALSMDTSEADIKKAIQIIGDTVSEARKVMV
jgi:cysteine desulfurase